MCMNILGIWEYMHKVATPTAGAGCIAGAGMGVSPPPPPSFFLCSIYTWYIVKPHLVIINEFVQRNSGRMHIINF